MHCYSVWYEKRCPPLVLENQLIHKFYNNMIITHKTYWSFVTAAALLLAASAPAQTVYDWVQAADVPSPLPYNVAITVTSDEITQISFEYIIGGGGSETIPITDTYQPLTVSDGTLEFQYGFGSADHNVIDIQDDFIVALLRGTNAYSDGSFINPLYVPPPATAPDSLSTWSLLISMAVGLILCHRRTTTTARE